MLVAERCTIPMITFSLFILLLLQPFISECSEDSNRSDKPLLYTRPEIISSDNNGDELKIGLKIGSYLNSTNIIVVLYKNKELSHTYKVYTQDEDGNLVPSRKAPHCQYTGHVLGHKSSHAIISTCDGISGKIKYGNVEYRIRPVAESTGNYHRHGNIDYGTDWARHQRVLEEKMSQLHELYEPPVHPGEFTFGHVNPLKENGYTKKERKTRQKRKIRTGHSLTLEEIMKINVKEERKFMEVSVLVDKQEHTDLGSNIQKTTDYVETVFNLVAAKFKPYNIIVCIVQLMIWNTGNPITVEKANFSKILDSLGDYRRETLIPDRWSDVTSLLTGHYFLEKKVIGAAFTGTICDDTHSANVNFDTALASGPENIDKPYYATLIAHEIGHIFGMLHDNDKNNEHKFRGKCGCPCRQEDFDDNYVIPDFCGTDDRCIMYPSLNTNYDYFSECSRLYLEERRPEQRCLLNVPKELRAGKEPVCGNAVIEEGETCDCGSKDDCPILDPCCEVGTCQLKNTSSCFTGLCCSSECQFKQEGTVCRDKYEGKECDFAETCSGNHSECQVDTYKQDGRTCTDESKNYGFCSSSDCMTHHSQCRYLFGKWANAGDDLCWKANEGNYWGGNCGYEKKEDDKVTFLPCKEENYQCGLLQCKVRTDEVDKANTHINDIYGADRVNFGSEHPPGKDKSYHYRCVTARIHAPPIDESVPGSDLDRLGFKDLGQVQDYTPCGGGNFCKSKKCTYEEPQMCPKYDGVECAGNGQCNNLNQCHCDEGWDSTDLCFIHTGVNYKTIIIVLCVVVVVLPLIVGVIVYVVKHNFDLKVMAADRDRITRGIRRFSSRAFSRQGSTRSDGSGIRDQITKGIRRFSSRASSRSDGSGNVKMPNIRNYARVPKISDVKETATTNPSPKPKKTGLRVPPPPPPTKKPGPKPPNRPAKPPAVTLSPLSSANSTPNSSTTKLDRASTRGGPPPVPPPPAPQEGGAPLLRNARAGLRPARQDSRTQSETFKNGTTIPLNNLAAGEKPVSESNLAKKQLQPPKLMAGRSREGKKLQISGPTNDSLVGLDGRPKSFHLGTDIKQSSDSIDTVSSTRALFDPNIKKKPPSAGSRWK